MPIEVTCTCGRELNLRDELAGKVVRCPACAGSVQVPVAVEEVVEDVAAGPPPPRSLRASAIAKPGDEPDVAPPAPRRSEYEKPKKKKKKKSVYSQVYGQGKDSAVAFEEGWLGSMNAGIWGGVASLLFGILLLVLCIIFWASIYGIAFSVMLIIGGMGACLKGLLDLYE